MPSLILKRAGINAEQLASNQILLTTSTVDLRSPKRSVFISTNDDESSEITIGHFFVTSCARSRRRECTKFVMPTATVGYSHEAGAGLLLSATRPGIGGEICRSCSVVVWNLATPAGQASSLIDHRRRLTLQQQSHNSMRCAIAQKPSASYGRSTSTTGSLWHRLSQRRQVRAKESTGDWSSRGNEFGAAASEGLPSRVQIARHTCDAGTPVKTAGTLRSAR
jgi:hypothetical protein